MPQVSATRPLRETSRGGDCFAKPCPTPSTRPSPTWRPFRGRALSEALSSPAKRAFRGRLRVVGGGVQCPFGLMDSEVPGVAVDEAAAGAGRVRLEAARSEQDPDAFGAQGLDDAAERGAGGGGRGDEGRPE